MPLAMKIILLLIQVVILAAMFSFLDRPLALLGLFLLPIAHALHLAGDTEIRRRLTLFFGATLLERQVPAVNHFQLDARRALLYFGIFLAVLCLAEPKWGFHWEEVHRRGSDILIAFDISESMLAEDLSPNRLEHSKRKIADLLARLEGDRVGMVVFSGTAFTLCPLTLDYGAVAMFLNDLDTEFLPIKGTNIAEALSTGLTSFQDAARESKAIILITDGEQNEGEVLKVAEDAAKQGVKIFCIGIGNPKKGGVPIPQKGGGMKKSKDGNIVLTRIDENLLAEIAHKTGGGYKLTESGDVDLIQIYEEIKARVEQKDLKSDRKKVFEHRYQWLLLLAILCLFFHFRLKVGLLRDSARGRAAHAT